MSLMIQNDYTFKLLDRSDCVGNLRRHPLQRTLLCGGNIISRWKHQQAKAAPTYDAPLVSQFVNQINYFYCLQSQVFVAEVWGGWQPGRGWRPPWSAHYYSSSSLPVGQLVVRGGTCKGWFLLSFASFSSFFFCLQVIQQLRSSPRYRPTRRPAGHQVTASYSSRVTQQSSTFAGCGWSVFVEADSVQYWGN